MPHLTKFIGAFALLSFPVCADIRFEDKTSGLPDHSYTGGWEHFVGGGAAVFDCNNDNLPEIFAAGGTSNAILLENQGDFKFSELDIGDFTGVTGAYPIDVNSDAIMDIFVMRVGPDLVLLGEGNCAFRDATKDLKIPQTDQWTTAFTAWWEGQKGPVMALGHYVDRSDPDGPFEACDTNTILRPHEGAFVSEELKPGHCALSMLAGPDARGRQTLRISNDRHYYIRDGQEQLWDIKEQRFLGESDGWPKVMLWGMGIASSDITGDGREEVMLTSMGDQLMQMATEKGAYEPAPFSIGTYAQRPHLGDDGRPSTGWHAQFGDVNNDGRSDLFIAKGNVDQMPGNAMNDPNNLLIQNENGEFEEVSVNAGVADTARSRGAALADFDGDGRLDLLVVNRRAQMRIYQNQSDAGNWVSVALRQKGANPFAIGAKVQVQDQMQHLRIGGGHASGQATALHFGLGEGSATSVDVVWPDGTRTKHPIQMNQITEITKTP